MSDLQNILLTTEMTNCHLKKNHTKKLLMGPTGYET